MASYSILVFEVKDTFVSCMPREGMWMSGGVDKHIQKLVLRRGASG
jgi:hypothetical protein